MLLRNLSSLSHNLVRLLRGEHGAGAVEFAIGATLLAGLLIPLIDLGMGFYQKMQVQDAAHGWNSTAIENAVTSATALASISASPAPARNCGCPEGTSVTSSACGGTCSGGQSVGTYVTVSAQANYTPLIPYPVIGQSVALTAQATVRIQ